MIYYDTKQSGERIRRLRKQNGYTQETLAEKLGISEDAIYRIENGRSGARVDLLLQLSDELHTSLDYLVTGREPEDEMDKMLERFDEKQRCEWKNTALVILKGLIQAYEKSA